VRGYPLAEVAGCGQVGGVDGFGALVVPGLGAGTKVEAEAVVAVATPSATDESASRAFPWTLSSVRLNTTFGRADQTSANSAPSSVSRSDLARLPGTSGLRCCLHPPMIDSHRRWISSRGPANPAAFAKVARSRIAEDRAGSSGGAS